MPALAHKTTSAAATVSPNKRGGKAIQPRRGPMAVVQSPKAQARNAPASLVDPGKKEAAVLQPKKAAPQPVKPAAKVAKPVVKSLPR